MASETTTSIELDGIFQKWNHSKHLPSDQHFETLKQRIDIHIDQVQSLRRFQLAKWYHLVKAKTGAAQLAWGGVLGLLVVGFFIAFYIVLSNIWTEDPIHKNPINQLAYQTQISSGMVKTQLADFPTFVNETVSIYVNKQIRETAAQTPYQYKTQDQPAKLIIQQRDSITLSPNSEMNIKSEYNIDKATYTTSLQLVYGKATFEPAHVPQGSSFQVQAGGFYFAVTGTVFDIEISDDNVLCTVKEGSVRVSTEDGGNLDLSPVVAFKGTQKQPINEQMLVMNTPPKPKRPEPDRQTNVSNRATPPTQIHRTTPNSTIQTHQPQLSNTIPDNRIATMQPTRSQLPEPIVQPTQIPSQAVTKPRPIHRSQIPSRWRGAPSPEQVAPNVLKYDFDIPLVAAPAMTSDQFILSCQDNTIYGVPIQRYNRFNWKYTEPNQIWTQPVHHQGVLVFATGRQEVKALAAENGTLLWTQHVSGLTLGQKPVISHGVAIFHSRTQGLVALTLRSGAVRWTVSLGGATDASQSLDYFSKNRLYAVTNQGDLLIIKPRTGDIESQLSFSEPLHPAVKPYVYSGYLVSYTQNRHLVCYALEEPEAYKWRFGPEKLYSDIIGEGANFYVVTFPAATGNGFLRSFRITDGTVNWNQLFQMQSGTNHVELELGTGGTLLLTGYNHHISVINRDSGYKLRDIPINGNVAATDDLSSFGFIVATRQGSVYRFK